MLDGDGSDARRWSARQWPDIDWATAAFRRGAFHLVLVADGGPVARIAIGLDHQARAVREASILETVARLPILVPVPRRSGQVATDAQASGILTTAVRGIPNHERSWNAPLANTYIQLLEQMHRVPTHLAIGLPPPRTWCGGPEWPALVAQLTGRLPAGLSRLARQVVTDALDTEAGAPRTFVHGDFGPHNLMWTGPAATGLIDFDHACIGDPAADVAPLISWHGATPVSQIVDAETLARAMTYRATLPLQVAAAAHLTGDRELEAHAVDNFAHRAQAGTLYDPEKLS